MCKEFFFGFLHEPWKQNSLPIGIPDFFWKYVPETSEPGTGTDMG